VREGREIGNDVPPMEYVGIVCFGNYFLTSFFHFLKNNPFLNGINYLKRRVTSFVSLFLGGT
jgi:hypothetical protein